ncbi:MAG: right-handed parallel beta-helix repeat-containing protein [Verrucomicrobia bacterium]|nr:right-handed parallel beta-helix repeat-containing protein [Verrucomicrobiota bacterium]
MRYLLFLIACSFAHAESDTLSPDRLSAFYEEFVYDENQSLALAGLTAPFTFWVSPNGNDAYPGTQQSPFLTLERARDAVRALPSSAFKQGDVYIYIEDGTYRLEQPLLLTASDSGRNGHDVVYSAAPGAHPLICGSVPVTGWTLHDGVLGIYQAPIGAYTSRQLYVNGSRAVRAKTTNYPAGFLPKWVNGGIEFIPTPINPPAWQDPQYWTHPQDIEAVILTQWKMMRVPLSTVIPYSDPLPGLITLTQPAWNNANVYFDINTGEPGEWSFWQVTWFENAYQFLTEPGQWYLDQSSSLVYYIPLLGEDITTATVELPILETLIAGQGSLDAPIHNIRFEGLTFSYATWLGPNGSNGYVSDQSAQLLLGSDHSSNVIGHDQNVVPTPGNLSFTFAHNIVFYGNIFEHLGAVALQFGLGSTRNTIDSNLFTDISSSAIELGGATSNDSHPPQQGYILSNNSISNNLIRNVAVEYMDAAGIFVGFTQNTTLIHNTITDVPWSGITIGWGWGLLDVGSYPGIPNAYSGEWGSYTTPTPNFGCRILQNKICNFLETLWDGGAIYTTGQQGPSLSQGLLIEGNVAYNKRPDGGGNTIYNDGGSRYIRVQSNASYNNPIGITFYGPVPNIYDPFFLEYPPYYLQNDEPYGSDAGGCRTYGDIDYSYNYWLETPIPTNIDTYNQTYHTLLGYYPYVSVGFFSVCPFTDSGISYPYNLSFENNQFISSMADIPSSLLSGAGVQSRPPTIPPSRWVLPPP